MFTDMKEALEAEALELTPTSSDQSAAASLVVAHKARDKDDLADLLGALGLPCGEDDLVRLLPHLTIPTGDPMPVNAFTATAVSMLNNGDSPEHVRETLGLSESELADALQHAGLPVSDADTEDSTSVPETAASAPASTTDADQIEALLAWAEKHSAATIRNRAARVRSDLTEPTERRASDAAQSAAEDRIAKARAELEAAQAELRQVKAGGRITTEDPATTSWAPVQGPGGKRSSEELAAIRTWARANGHQVADRGNPAKTVLDAYDAAQRTTALAEAS
ncbi:Lsr2 family DNA-binding protein [Streptomyces mirabilis]|uniref:Lsr2 family DNA-binding protein n=1 Tax=Streptomyces mirabilis TaxID=68239 RepID=UPI003659C253